MSYKKQYAVDLAIRLVTDQYGDATGRVFKQLAVKGQLPVAALVRDTGLAAPMVKQALLILLQQNAITAYLQPGEETPRGPKPSVPVYEVQVDRVLQMLRHSRFLLHIKDEAGDVAEHIVAVLLQEGRLRMDQILGSVAARMGQAQEEVADQIRNNFITLVQAHYVERSPPCTLPPPAIAPHPASVKTRKAKTGSEAHAAEQAAALKSFEEAVYDKQRFKVPTELALEMFAAGEEDKGANGTKASSPGAEGEGEGMDVDGGPGAGGKRGAEGDGDDLAFKTVSPAKKAKIRAGTARPDVGAGGGGRGAGGGGGPGSPGQAAEPSVILWRINNDEFNRRFRHQAMVALIREKFDDDAAAVVTAMLAAGRAFETSVKEERGVTLSEDEVESTANKLVESGVIRSMAGVSVPGTLRTLANDAFDMFTHVGIGPQGTSTYVVNSQRIIDLIMLKQVEAVVKCKFGVEGLRIFRLLALRGQLEQKQVADLAMMPTKETRELLYRMLAEGYLMIQDIPKTSDRAPSRTFYTWRVSMLTLSDATAAHLYRAAARVYARLKFEVEKEKELVAMIESAKESKTVTFTLTQAQRQAVARLKRVTEVMETSLQHLDEMIAIFNDF